MRAGTSSRSRWRCLLCIYVRLSTYTPKCIRVNMCVCVFVWARVFRRASLYICVYIYTYRSPLPYTRGQVITGRPVFARLPLLTQFAQAPSLHTHTYTTHTSYRVCICVYVMTLCEWKAFAWPPGLDHLFRFSLSHSPFPFLCLSLRRRLARPSRRLPLGAFCRLLCRTRLYVRYRGTRRFMCEIVHLFC